MQDLSPIEWAVRPIKKYAVFSGRAPRAEYWWYYLGTIIIGIPLRLFDQMLGTNHALTSIFNLALLVPWLAVTVRRLHDTDRSGWWTLGLVVAAIGFGVVVAGATSESLPTIFTGMIFTGVIFAIVMLLLVLIIITLIVFMVLPGAKGPNRYGPDPYDEDNLEEVFA